MIGRLRQPKLRIRGDLSDNLEKAIAAFEAALTVWTRKALPREWAATQDMLGSAYGRGIRRCWGNHRDDAQRVAYQGAPR